jgi:hypothetical protein
VRDSERKKATSKLSLLSFKELTNDFPSLMEEVSIDVYMVIVYIRTIQNMLPILYRLVNYIKANIGYIHLFVNKSM